MATNLSSAVHNTLVSFIDLNEPCKFFTQYNPLCDSIEVEMQKEAYKQLFYAKMRLNTKFIRDCFIDGSFNTSGVNYLRHIFKTLEEKFEYAAYGY